MCLPKLNSEDANERSFARFSYRMRKEYNSGKLSADHIKVLEKIPGWSWTIKKNIPTPPPEISTYIHQDTQNDVEMATRISEMFIRNKLSPVYFHESKGNFAGKRLILFRDQYKKGCLSTAIENILIPISKSWAHWGDVSEDDVFHDHKFDDYLCYNKLPNDVYYRCVTATHLAKEWHTKYLKRKLDIFDSKIPGEIYNFESSLFSLKFINLLRKYFNGEPKSNVPIIQ